MNKRYGNCIEGISKQKLYKNGYKIYIEYWSDKISQQNIITKLKHLTEENYEYVYTQKRDKTGLFKVTIYIKEKWRKVNMKTADIYLLYVLLNLAKGSIKIPKLLRHVFEKYENLNIDIFLNIFDFACTPKEEIIVDSELLHMISVHNDSQRAKVI